MNAVFAGSFDPFTLGHYEIVKRALSIFDKIVVAVAEDTGKKAAPIAKRILMAKRSLVDLCQAEVVGFSGMTTDFCHKNGINVLLRGIRNIQDLEYEKNLMTVYKQMAEVETVYIISQLPHISSSQVRLLACDGIRPDGYVKNEIIDTVLRIYGKH